MANRDTTTKVILVGLLAVIVGVAVWQLQTSDAKVGTPTPSSSAAASTSSTETTVSAAPSGRSTPMAPANDRPDKATPPRRALTEAARRQLKVALEAERTLRTAREPSSAARSASGEDAVPTVLTIANKTGSSSEWEKRQLETLNQLLGECYDLGASEEPGLSGTLGIRFALHGEPEIGGLVEGIEFMDDYSTIEQATMRECARESLYALELDPPPEGITAAREITLRFDPE